MDSGMMTGLTVVYGLGSLVQLGAAIALLLTVIQVVRRHRPDAYRLLMWAAILELVSIGVGYAFTLLTPVISATSGTSSVIAVQIVRGFVGTMFTVAISVCLIVGIARVARPFVEPKPDAEGPYR